MRKIKLHSSDGKKTVSISPDRIEEVKKTDIYDKIFQTNLRKAGRKLEDKIYFANSFWKDLLMVIFGAFLSALAVFFFVNATGKSGIFPGGIAAIARLLDIVTQDALTSKISLYWIFYFILNVPLIIFGILKVGKKFSIMTLIYIGASIGFGFLLGLIPLEKFYVLINLQEQLGKNYFLYSIWIFVFAIFGGMLIGFSYAITYKASASSGGTDFITVYISQTKNKNIAKINSKVNLAIMLFAITINAFVMSENDIAEILWDDRNKPVYVFDRIVFVMGPSLFSSILYVLITWMTMDKFYPKSNIFTFFISTIKPEEIQKFLFNAGYQNNVFSWVTDTNKKGKEKESKTILMVQMGIMDWEKVGEAIQQIDLHANVNYFKTRKVQGPFQYTFDNDKSWNVIMHKIKSSSKKMKKLEDDSIISAYHRIKKNELKVQKRQNILNKKTKDKIEN